MKRFSRWFIILFMAVFLTATINIGDIYANSVYTSTEDKIYCQAMIEDDFADDKVIVTLKRDPTEVYC